MKTSLAVPSEERFPAMLVPRRSAAPPMLRTPPPRAKPRKWPVPATT
ncbi:MAG: hypothetical protein ACXWOA_05025 [Isosphaeraceae bacterium]